MRRGSIFCIIGLVILILALAIGPFVGPSAKEGLKGPLLGVGLPLVGVVFLGIGLFQMFAKPKPTVKKDVFIKCAYCRATIPIDSEKCPVCGADLKK
jgi:hypothetical protein